MERFRNAMLEDKDKLEVNPVDWAIERLKRLKEKWYILKIVTARVSDLFWEYTQKWIDKNYPNIFEEIVFANHFTKEDKTKSELCKEHELYIWSKIIQIML
jgi:hypothetical protein